MSSTNKEKESSHTENTSDTKSKNYQPPKGQKKTWSCKLNQKNTTYNVVADWLLIRKNEKPTADIFYTYYSCKSLKKQRPITFVFNGGPGASSAYLHIGALGPKTVSFGKKGEFLPPPAILKNNPDTWLSFTDLVFVDPVGTGFSRSLDEIDFSSVDDDKDKNKNDSQKPSHEFYKLNRDLETLTEFIQKFLSKKCRWASPVYIAGESYGGFRVGKLAKSLQENGIGLCGVILISPCLEMNALSSSDYDILHWIDTFPTMVASAVYHKKSAYSKKQTIGLEVDLKTFFKTAETFAINELSSLLLQGSMMELQKQKNIIQKISDFFGISFETINKSKGRLPLWQFCRYLLQKDRKWCSMYDTSTTSYDPFPNREHFEGADPLFSAEHVFNHGINTLLTSDLKLDCDRDYRILSTEVNMNWKLDQQNHFFDIQMGATDDLRIAMTMNQQMKVFICHGVFDLVTPYFSSQRVIQSMNLPPMLQKQLSFEVFFGGHMFYTWEHSRKLFKKHIQSLYLV